MIEAIWTEASNRSFVALESSLARQPLIKIALQIEGVPAIGQTVLVAQPVLLDREAQEPGCSVWLFSDEAVPFDNARTNAEFASAPSTTCTLTLTDVTVSSEDTGTRSFQLHGTFQGGLEGGASTLSPAVKRAQLYAGF
ncbi:MAG: hypothetical protein Q8L48_37690 [Archangium sp.]|nr:hypothetical protein [Archangium sp.]